MIPVLFTNELLAAVNTWTRFPNTLWRYVRSACSKLPHIIDTYLLLNGEKYPLECELMKISYTGESINGAASSSLPMDIGRVYPS